MWLVTIFNLFKDKLGQLLVIRCSIMVSIPVCRIGDPGSIPGGGAFFQLNMRKIYKF